MSCECIKYVSKAWYLKVTIVGNAFTNIYHVGKVWYPSVTMWLKSDTQQ